MKYSYAYKTSDGTRHEASMDAESREAVFVALRARGIKAIKVTAADGSKANGEVRGVRKRVLVAAVIGAAVLAVAGTVVVGRTLRVRRGAAGVRALPSDSVPRHQIYGDPAILAAFGHGNFDAVFTNRMDRMLAWFAQPGQMMCPKGVDPRRMANEFAAACAQPFGKTGQTSFATGKLGQTSFATLPLEADDPREVRELKQIVNGMRGELSAYLANGNGTPRSYWRRLLERTQQEVQIRERIRRELESEKDDAVWDEKNEALRRLGLRTIPNERTDD